MNSMIIQRLMVNSRRLLQMRSWENIFLIISLLLWDKVLRKLLIGLLPIMIKHVSKCSVCLCAFLFVGLMNYKFFSFLIFLFSFHSFLLFENGYPSKSTFPTCFGGIPHCWRSEVIYEWFALSIRNGCKR